jgi:hypothetical protein
MGNSSANLYEEKLTMKLKLTFLLIFLGTLLAPVQLAFSLTAKESTSNLLDPYINPQASGQKFSGTLAINYVGRYPVPDSDTTCGELKEFGPYTDMYFSFRLSKGNIVYPFSGVATHVCLLDYDGVQAARLVKFINDTIIPIVSHIAPPSDFPPSTTSVWSIKSIKNIMQNDSSNVNSSPTYIDPVSGSPVYCCGPPGKMTENYFSMLDIELAVP